MTKNIAMAADIKFKIIIKYVPEELPSHPNISFFVSAICANEEYLQKTSWGSHCGPFLRDTRGRRESRSHGGGKLPGTAVRPWINYAGGSRIETVTSVHYHRQFFWGGADMDIK